MFPDLALFNSAKVIIIFTSWTCIFFTWNEKQKFQSFWQKVFQVSLTLSNLWLIEVQIRTLAEIGTRQVIDQIKCCSFTCHHIGKSPDILETSLTIPSFAQAWAGLIYGWANMFGTFFNINMFREDQEFIEIIKYLLIDTKPYLLDT